MIAIIKFVLFRNLTKVLIHIRNGGQAELFASKKKNNVLLSILSSEATKEDVIN